MALEVKSECAQSTSGMGAFKKAFPPDKLLLIGSPGLAWQDFLPMNPEELFSRQIMDLMEPESCIMPEAEERSKISEI
jgi:hypothetical protein